MLMMIPIIIMGIRAYDHFGGSAVNTGHLMWGSQVRFLVESLQLIIIFNILRQLITIDIERLCHNGFNLKHTEINMTFMI